MTEETRRDIYTTKKALFGIYTKEDEKEFAKKYPKIYAEEIAIWKD